jgi:hypothetical protein
MVKKRKPQPKHTLVAEIPTRSRPRKFTLGSGRGLRITGTVPSNHDGIVAIRIYGVAAGRE